MTENYDDLPLWSAPFGLILLDVVQYRKGIAILDIGSGGGFPMLELAGRFGAGCTVFGLDSSEDACRMIHDKIKAGRIENAGIIKGSAEKMPFGDNIFGLIVSNNGLNNTEDEKRGLQECYRVAAAGCQMVLTMNLPGSFTEFYATFEETLVESGLEDERKKMHEHIFNKRKPVEYWKKLITEAGFQVNSVIPGEFRMKFTDGTSFFSHPLIVHAFRPSWEELLPEAKRETLFASIEQKLNNKADTEGGLTMSIPYACYDCSRPDIIIS